MAKHTIMLPDWLRGRELGAILWDDEAGTVAGDHVEVSQLRQFLEAPKPVTVGDPGGTWDLIDPGHDPAEFLTLLAVALPGVLDGPLRSTLPAIFDGVAVPDPDPGEFLYNADGSVLV